MRVDSIPRPLVVKKAGWIRLHQGKNDVKMREVLSKSHPNLQILPFLFSSFVNLSSVCKILGLFALKINYCDVKGRRRTQLQDERTELEEH